MAGGWSKDGAVQEQIDASVEDGVRRARSRLPRDGESLAWCCECDAPIPRARQQAVPGVRHCVACQAALDEESAVAGFNRRGSKDSQLR